MSAISLNKLYTIFTKHDLDKNGKMDKQEIAKASLILLESDTTKEEGQLLATFLQGGKDKTGLFPDTDNDNMLAFSEMLSLAEKAGDSGKVGTDDFEAAFAGKTVAGGNVIDKEALKTQAGINQSTNANGANAMNMMMKLLMMMFSIFSQQQPQQQYYNPYQQSRW